MDVLCDYCYCHNSVVLFPSQDSLLQQQFQVHAFVTKPPDETTTLLLFLITKIVIKITKPIFRTYKTSKMRKKDRSTIKLISEEVETLT